MFPSRPICEGIFKVPENPLQVLQAPIRSITFFLGEFRALYGIYAAIWYFSKRGILKTPKLLHNITFLVGDIRGILGDRWDVAGFFRIYLGHLIGIRWEWASYSRRRAHLCV
jgi:hypothetical protein